MSQPSDPSQRAIARQALNLVRGFTAARTGRVDRGTDRQVRRHSYDVNDTRAQPWHRVGDGSAAQGLAYREALLKTAKDLYHQEWKEGAEERLRRIDLTVLEALISRIDFATGRLFPALDTIAADAGCHRNSVIAGLRRLKARGLIDWVRRSIKTDNEGQFAPQREQTSNAYFFAHRRAMAKRTWQRFWQLLQVKLRRLGAVPAGLAPATPPRPTNPALRAALDALDALVPGEMIPSVST